MAGLARRADRLENLVKGIERTGGTALARSVDVADAVALRAAAEQVATELGTVGLFFNNAGRMLPAPVEEPPVEQWQHQIDLNVTALMNAAIGAFVPQLVAAAADKGVADLVNTSSVAARNIFPNFAVYSGTKAYVTHLSRTLRVELGAKDVRVSAIEPGIVGTELPGYVTDADAQERLEGSKKEITWLVPEDVAEAINVLVSAARTREPPAGHDHAAEPVADSVASAGPVSPQQACRARRRERADRPPVRALVGVRGQSPWPPSGGMSSGRCRGGEPSPGGGPGDESGVMRSPAPSS